MRLPLSSAENAIRGLHWVKATTGLLRSKLLKKHRPIWVNIEPTHRCNLACTYCDKASNEEPGMSREQLVWLVGALADAGTLSVCFDGGEPLVHPAIGDALALAKSRGLRTSLSSNGHLIPRRTEIMRHVDVVKISIDGPPGIHDRGRGEGAYVRALEGARTAQALGIGVALRMTLARHNAHSFQHVLDLARQLGVQALFQPAIGSLMEASAEADDESPEPEVYRRAMSALREAKRAGAPVGNEFVCIDHLARFPAPTPVPFCAGGRVEVAIGPEGGMFPCGRVGRGPQAPNVFELGVEEAFHRTLRPSDCANCWCTLTLGNCYAYDLAPRLLEGRLLPPSAPPELPPVAPPERRRLPLL